MDQTPFLMCVDYGNLDMVKLFIRLGAEVHATDKVVGAM